MRLIKVGILIYLELESIWVIKWSKALTLADPSFFLVKIIKFSMFVSSANSKYGWDKFMNSSGYICRGYPGFFKPNNWNQALKTVLRLVYIHGSYHWDITSSKSKRKYWWEERARQRKSFFNGEKLFIHYVDKLVWTNNLCLIFLLKLLAKYIEGFKYICMLQRAGVMYFTCTW